MEWIDKILNEAEKAKGTLFFSNYQGMPLSMNIEDVKNAQEQENNFGNLCYIINGVLVDGEEYSIQMSRLCYITLLRTIKANPNLLDDAIIITRRGTGFSTQYVITRA